MFCLSIWEDFVSALGARAFPETGRGGEAEPKCTKMQSDIKAIQGRTFPYCKSNLDCSEILKDKGGVGAVVEPELFQRQRGEGCVQMHQTSV